MIILLLLLFDFKGNAFFDLAGLALVNFKKKTNKTINLTNMKVKYKLAPRNLSPFLLWTFLFPNDFSSV